MTDRPITTYSFGPIERRGILGALDAGQAVVLGGGGVVAVAILDLAPSAGGALLALALLAMAALVAVIPIAGRNALAWAGIGSAFAVRRTRARRHRRVPAAVTAGSRLTLDAGRASHWRTSRPTPPPGLGEVEIVACDYRGRRVGVLSDGGGRRLTATLACRVDAFALLDPEAQTRRLNRWGGVLAAAAGTSVRRIGWIERTAPAAGDELARWLSAERDPTIPLRGTPMIDSYLELISGGAAVTQEHEILLTVQVDGRPSAGSTRGLDDLLEHTERIAHGIEAAEVAVLGILGPDQVARVLRTSYDPFARAELAAADAADAAGAAGDGGDAGGAAGDAGDAGGDAGDAATDLDAWPLGVRESWDRLQSDGAVHATFWISAWPRVEVSALFLGPLLGRSAGVRTMAVTFEPLPLARSTREVEAAVTRDLADRQLRRRFGQAETARQRQLAGATRRREAELAAGHAEVRLAGYVTVSARDETELRRACADVIEHAARARLELHRLYGHQAEAFAFTLPLCRGLR
jgi:hypothetical protein